MPFPIGVGGDSGALERGLALVVLVEYGGGVTGRVTLSKSHKTTLGSGLQL